MGVAAEADNARTLLETKHAVAAYRYRPLPVHVLSGQVRTPGGTVVSGVSMDGLPGEPTTDEDGQYQTQIPSGWAGASVPRKSGFVFEPRQRLYSSVTQDQSNENYTGWTCELSDALDAPGLSFTTGGHADWRCQNAVTLDGLSAAGHGGIFSNQEAWMECDLEGPGELTFHWKVSSTMDADFLEFSVDGQQYDAISGEVDWELRAYQFPVGTRTVRWRFFKDSTENSGANRGWVDQVSWVRHFIISTTATPPEGGAVFGDGIYMNGTEALLYAVPNPGYHFLGWGEQGEVFSTEPVLLLTPAGDREFTAYFELKQYTLTNGATASRRPTAGNWTWPATLPSKPSSPSTSTPSAPPPPHPKAAASSVLALNSTARRFPSPPWPTRGTPSSAGPSRTWNYPRMLSCAARRRRRVIWSPTSN
jgi:hypothetical protein